MKKANANDFEMPIHIRQCHTGWLLVDGYLDGLEACASELMQDPEYKERFDALRCYTNRQLYGSDEYNMIERILTIYQDAEDCDE